MAENINLDVNGIIQTILSLRTDAASKQASIDSFIRLVLNRDTYTISDLQDVLQTALHPITVQLQEIMATLTQFQDALTRINTATSSVAAVLLQIRDKVAQLETNAGISANEETSVVNQLSGIATSLEDMAKTPENPVPTEPPTGGGETTPPAEPPVTPAP